MGQAPKVGRTGRQTHNAQGESSGIEADWLEGANNHSKARTVQGRDWADLVEAHVPFLHAELSLRCVDPICSIVHPHSYD